ncbi:hypothetical protein B0H13DRAFT_2377713 [Mycena leptocephala]|nr:hypothetical protein B0H13DRAFT_2377713 [Mycena leptocephala]
MHGNFTSPTYASPATPYIMFIPSVHPWYGPLLNRLNYKRSGLPIIEFEHGRWGLASSLADDWWTLETNLRRVLNAMMDIAKKRTKGMVPFGWPSRWGYLNKFRTEQSARTAIVRAIRGFLPLIGSLSMYFWYMELRGYLRDSAGEVLAVHDLPDWRELSRPPGTSLFLELGNTRFQCPSCSFPELVDMPRDFDWIIPAIISTRLPMPCQVAFSRWSSAQATGKNMELTSCRETHPYVAPPLDAAPPTDAAPSPSPISSSPPLAPFPLSSAIQKNAQTAASETLDNKRRREQREANAQKGQVPGRKGARVFVWEKENGQYIRRAAGRNKYEDVWEEYGPEQRQYDSYYDEWDVCEQFGPAAEPEEDWNDIGGSDGQEDDDVPSEMLAEAAVLQPSGSHTSEEDLDRIHPIATESESTETGSSTALIAPTFKEMVRLRFGCTVTQEKVTTSLELPEALLAKKFLGDTSIHISDETN